MKFFGENNHECVKGKIRETLELDEVELSWYDAYEKVICSYLMFNTVEKNHVRKIYQEYLDESIKLVLEKGEKGLKAASCLRLLGENSLYRETLKRCTPYIFGIEYEGYIPVGDYECYSGGILQKQLHALLLQKKFFDFYAQTSTDSQAYILGYIPKTPWRKSNYIDLIYTAKCIEKVSAKEAPLRDVPADWWIDTYHALYLYNTQEDNKEDYAQIARNNVQKIIDGSRFYVCGDGAYIIDLVLEYPEIFEGALDGKLEVRKVKTKLDDFNKLRLSSPLKKEEEILLKELKKSPNLNFGYGEKPSKLKKLKEVSENLIISMHNDKYVEVELLEELKENKEKFLDESFLKYCTNLYRQTIYYRLLNLENESNVTLTKLKELVIDNEGYLIKEEKVLSIGYGYYYLYLLEKTKDWKKVELENSNEELNDYLEKIKFYLAADEKDEKLEKGEISEPIENDELPDSYMYNAYAHLLTNDLGKFKATIYASGVDLNSDIAEVMTLEGFVVDDATVKSLISSSDELIKIHKIRDEKMDINTSKLNLIKKLNALTKAKDKEKAKQALDKTKDKTYNGIKGINEMVELIPFILSM
ncbi:hypothetical protein M4I33_15170 [Clostridium sp. LY3-2]|uniref:hypothetical protein n=1 Tax=Clostridium sp. LY3-2 TaxID=2942482 RepID=UPI002153A17A|nr:hypothetical protein [Clostridium sp. LY3-2]MCR6516208.1 hypothetical protein [Clostridium sp. LY3-2]